MVTLLSKRKGRKKMKNTRKFLRCEICGNIVGLIHDGGGVLTCCNQAMNLLTENTVDATVEKHIPVATLKNNTICVEVGTVAHPMTNEHYIEWIAIAQGNTTQRVSLRPNDAPTAKFMAGKGDITIYAYCNLHGLWATDQIKEGDENTVCSAEFSEGCK